MHTYLPVLPHCFLLRRADMNSPIARLFARLTFQVQYKIKITITHADLNVILSSWTVWRRFSEFRALDDVVRTSASDFPFFLQVFG
jgi:hypothetical protein